MTGAERLAAVLRAENAALTQLDHAGSAALLNEKLAALQAFSASSADAAALPALSGLAAENKRLLERAITVQGRVLDIVAQAARQAPSAGRYGATGGRADPGGPMALISRA